MLPKHFFALLCCLLVTVGCGGTDSKSETASPDGEDFLSDFLKEIDLAETPVPKKQSDGGGDTETTEDSGKDDIVTVAALAEAGTKADDVVTAEAVAVTPATSGKTISLLKTVEQTLVQKTPAPASATTRVQTWMTIRVTDASPQETTMSLEYDRVVYFQEINGQKLTYDSQSGIAQVPIQAQAYAGLVDNGFQFRVDSSKRVAQVNGYDAFLQKCGSKMDDTIKQLTLTSMNDQTQAVNRFVDETFGLFREGGTTQVGSTWQTPHIVTAEPLTKIDLRCRLLSLNEQDAEIDLSGSYQPAVPLPGVSGVQINQCRTLGTCRIDRATGIPLKLNRSVYLTMSLVTPDGQTATQEKRIQTTIEPTVPTLSGSIVPVSANTTADEIARARSAVSQRVSTAPSSLTPTQGSTSAPLSSTARAVYPD